MAADAEGVADEFTRHFAQDYGIFAIAVRLYRVDIAREDETDPVYRVTGAV